MECHHHTHIHPLQTCILIITTAFVCDGARAAVAAREMRPYTIPYYSNDPVQSCLLFIYFSHLLLRFITVLFYPANQTKPCLLLV